MTYPSLSVPLVEFLVGLCFAAVVAGWPQPVAEPSKENLVLSHKTSCVCSDW